MLRYPQVFLAGYSLVLREDGNPAVACCLLTEIPVLEVLFRHSVLDLFFLEGLEVDFGLVEAEDVGLVFDEVVLEAALFVDCPVPVDVPAADQQFITGPAVPVFPRVRVSHGGLHVFLRGVEFLASREGLAGCFAGHYYLKGFPEHSRHYPRPHKMHEKSRIEPDLLEKLMEVWAVVSAAVVLLPNACEYLPEFLVVKLVLVEAVIEDALTGVTQEGADHKILVALAAPHFLEVLEKFAHASLLISFLRGLATIAEGSGRCPALMQPLETEVGLMQGAPLSWLHPAPNVLESLTVYGLLHPAF
jgi:hypothetical protein